MMEDDRYGRGDYGAYQPRGYRAPQRQVYRRSSADWDHASALSDVDTAGSSPRVRPGYKRQRTIVCLGSKGVGKSSLIRQYAEATFTDVYTPTIQSAYRKDAEWAGESVELILRDTAGANEVADFHLQFSGVHGWVIMYSVTNRQTFEDAKFVHDNLLMNLMGATDDIPVVLVGNKCDLDSGRHVSMQDGRSLAAKWGCPFVETSAKKNERVDEVFSLLLGQIYKGEYSPPQRPSCLSCRCSAEEMTSVQQARIVTAYLCLLMFVMICSLFTCSAGLAFVVGQASTDESAWLLIAVGAFGVIVSGVGVYGSLKLKAGAVRCAAICIVLLTVLHICAMIYAIQDNAFERWLQFGGAATMLVASALDVIVQLVATALSCLVFNIAAQTFEHSNGYAMMDHDGSMATGQLLPFTRGSSWSGEPTSEH